MKMRAKRKFREAVAMLLIKIINARIIGLFIAVIYGNYANACTAVGQNCIFFTSYV
jgi:hypothetical protein